VVELECLFSTAKDELEEKDEMILELARVVEEVNTKVDLP